MKVSDLIETLQQEIEESPSFADLDVLMVGEESGDIVDVTGFYQTASSIRFASEEAEDDDD